MQRGNDFKELNCHWRVKDRFTEPNYPNQNPAEMRAVKWIKDHSQVIMNQSGAPPYVWMQAASYLASINNITAHETLNWRTPKEKRHGVTPDISAYTHFTFWEPIYYLNVEKTYPESRELAGRYLGVAENEGDALTFKILTDDTHQEITRSMIRSAVNSKRFGFPNERVKHVEYEPKPPTQKVPQVDKNKPVIPVDATDHRHEGRVHGEDKDREVIQTLENSTNKISSGNSNLQTKELSFSNKKLEINPDLTDHHIRNTRNLSKTKENLVILS